MIKLLLATNNQGKLAELQSLLSELNIELLSPKDLDLDIQVNYLENAVLKAAIFADAAKIWTLADDSGLEVEALDGAPGLYSARYAPEPNATDKDRRHYLVKNLEGIPQPWKASFQSMVALVGPEGSPIVTKGTCPGHIVPEGRGHGGFGYDRIFRLEETGLTMAELTTEHLAVKKLIPILESLFVDELVSE